MGAALSREKVQFLLLAAKTSSSIVIMLALPAAANSLRVFGCTVAFLCLAWSYSTPPLRAKNQPILDSFFNGLMCLLFWASGYVFDGKKTLLWTTDHSATNGHLVFLFASALHSLAAVEDAKADAFAGDRTIATVFGERIALLFSLVCL